jgi:glutathione S-transferase
VQVLEARLIGQDYLLRSGFSAADIGIGYSLHLADRLIDLAKLPNVARYLQRLRTRPAFCASLPEGSSHAISWLPQSEPIK